MISRILRTQLLLFLVPLFAAGCTVDMVGPAAPVATEAYATSWIEQLKLRFEQPVLGPRVASISTQRWHRARLTVGRLDETTAASSVTLEATAAKLHRGVLGGFAPGEGYWVQLELLFTEPSGVERVVGFGRLGGEGQSVMLHAGPNAVPMPVAATVPGVRLDTSPTPLRRPTRQRSAGAIVIIDRSDAPVWQPRSDAIIEEAPAPGWDTGAKSGTSDGEWSWPEAEDADSEEGSESASTPADSEEDWKDSGDWVTSTSALRTARQAP